MILSKKELSKLHEDNTDVYNRNMVDRYLISWKSLSNTVQFIKSYQLQAKPIQKDSQPKELADKLFEAHHFTDNSYPDVLMFSSGENLYYHCVELWYCYIIVISRS